MPSVDKPTQRRLRFEINPVLCRNLDRLTGLGIYALSRIPPFQFKDAETGNAYSAIAQKSLMGDASQFFEQVTDGSLRGSSLVSDAPYQIRKGYLVTQWQPSGILCGP